MLVHRLAPLALSLAVLAPLVDAAAPRQDEPTKEEITAAVTTLRAAFAGNRPEERIRALRNLRVPAAGVVAFQARGLGDDDVRVRQAALEALRFTDHKDALRVLHKTAKHDKDLRTDQDLGPLLYKAIGQHGKAASIELLEDKLFSEKNRDIVQARIYALGNVRRPEAVEALMDLMRSAKGTLVKSYARPLRISLMTLTGVDRGESPERWLDWWSDAKDELELPEEPPLLPVDLQRSWDGFWGIRRAMPRGERREDRGGDEGRGWDEGLGRDKGERGG